MWMEGYWHLLYYSLNHKHGPMFFTFLIQYFTISEGRKKEERMGGRTEGRIKRGKKEETGGQLQNP